MIVDSSGRSEGPTECCHKSYDMIVRVRTGGQQPKNNSKVATGSAISALQNGTREGLI